jgi:hypothetical protein
MRVAELLCPRPWATWQLASSPALLQEALSSALALSQESVPLSSVVPALASHASPLSALLSHESLPLVSQLPAHCEQASAVSLTVGEGESLPGGCTGTPASL